MVEGERVVGRLLDLESVEVMLQALADDAIVFLRLNEALRRSWVSLDTRRIYQKAFETICREAMREVAGAGQRKPWSGRRDRRLVRKGRH